MVPALPSLTFIQASSCLKVTNASQNSQCFKQILKKFRQLQESRVSVAIVVCMALFTDILAYGMVVPIFTEEILGFSLTQVRAILKSFLFPSIPTIGIPFG